MNKVSNYELVKFIDNTFELNVNVSPNEETVWLNANEMAFLFERDYKTILKHINNIFSEKELDKTSNSQKMRLSNNDKPTIYYNLNVIISVGYRVKSNRGVKFRQWATKLLREYLLKGYIINEKRVLVSNENYIELRNEVADINNRLSLIETNISQKAIGQDKLFFEGEFYDAYTLIQSIFEQANNEIIIIDNYIDRSILDRLVVKKKYVSVCIYTKTKTSILLEEDVNKFNAQYNNLEIVNTNKSHDRYIIIDRCKLYHIGASIKDLGKKIFSISLSDKEYIQNLLSNIK